MALYMNRGWCHILWFKVLKNKERLVQVNQVNELNSISKTLLMWIKFFFFFLMFYFGV